MKFLLQSIPAIFLLFSFSNCANGKKLQQEPPAAVKEAYFTTWTGGVKGAGSGLNLFIPVEEEADIVLDSVYFRGRRAALSRDDFQKGIYVARFKTSALDREGRDIVMHVDPEKEYGNPPPAIIEDIPFELKEDEAVVRYSRDGVVKYFRLTGIKRDESDGVKIKKPENIQH